MISLMEIQSQRGKREVVSTMFSRDVISFAGAEYPISGNQPFDISLYHDPEDHLLISGGTTLTVSIPCDRCLEVQQIPLELSIDHVLQITDGSLTPDEDEEISFVTADGMLDTDQLIFDEILVNWPTKVLCKEDCKGLCPVCGQNLNVSECGCDRQVIDPRMAKFQDIFQEFKEV